MSDRAELHAAVDRALDARPDDSAWENLVLATTRLAEASFRWDEAIAAYRASKAGTA